MNKLLKLFAIVLLVASCSKADDSYNMVVVTSNGNEILYNVEVADTPMLQAKGLMNRTSLAANSGMIFPIHPVRRVAMWMKATQIPLDMVFVGTDGTILQIVENTKPMSEDHITSDAPVRAIIEINGGDSKKHLIKVGDKIKNEIFGNLPRQVTTTKTDPKK